MYMYMLLYLETVLNIILNPNQKLKISSSISLIQSMHWRKCVTICFIEGDLELCYHVFGPYKVSKCASRAAGQLFLSQQILLLAIT